MRKKQKLNLSDRHHRIMQFLAVFQQRFGYPPTIRQIMKKTGITSTSLVNHYLNQLVEAGFIEREEHVSRGLRLVKLPEDIEGAIHRSIPGLRCVPVLGRIVAGAPIPVPATDFALYDPESTLEIPDSLLPTPDGELFALEVEGNSMIDAMINDGDMVVLRPAQQARNGDMVAAWLKDGETTLKRYYLENGQVRLQPANPDYEPILADPQDVLIQGKVVLVVRRVG